MKTTHNATDDIFFEPVEAIQRIHLDQQYTTTDECIGRVYLSYDYSRFVHYDENRVPDHYRLIAENIKSNGAYDSPILTEYDPKTRKLKIADGGNTFEARKNLGLPIPYVVFQGDGRRLMKALNVTRKNWGQTNYLHFYAASGRDEYKKAESFMASHPRYPKTALLELLTQSYTKEHTGITRLKEGALVIEDLDWSSMFIGKIDELAAVEPAGKNIVHSNKFLRAMTRILRYHPEFDFQHFRGQLSTYPSLFLPCLTCEGYAGMIETLYNYNQKKNGRTRIDLHDIPWTDKHARHPKAIFPQK